MLLAHSARACTPTSSLNPAVPTWEAVNHFVLGSRPATDEEITAYLDALAHSSARVRVSSYGRSWQGRPLPYALVSSPAQLSTRRQRQLSTRLRAVRAGTASPRQRRAVLAGPAVTWLAGSVHSNEPSGSDADMRLLYELAADNGCATVRRLRQVMLVVAPLQNPDGRAAGTRVNAYGFDLNRDWFAQTQPETRARTALLSRFPPVVLGDQHEQSGSGFFFPPNADPIHHEVPTEGLAAIEGILGPALARAFDARGLEHASYGPYDLFFMGLSDVASSTLFGSAGITLEKGADAPFPDRVAGQLLAAQTLVTSVATHRSALLRGWVGVWSRAAAQGARGLLAPNRVLEPGNQVRRPVPPGRVYAYLLSGTRSTADAEALAATLRSQGVAVYRSRRPLALARYHPYGTHQLGPATLGAGALVVPMDQAQKHWVQALLGEDSYSPFPYFYDVSAWSAPLLAGLEGGYTAAPLARAVWRHRRPGPGLVPWRPAPRSALPAAAGYWLPTDSERSLELAFALQTRGVRLSRISGRGTGPSAGAIVEPGAVDRRLLARLAAAYATRPRVLASVPPGTVALRAPSVAMLAPTTPASSAGQPEHGTGPALSFSWWRFELEQRLGLSIAMLRPGDLESGRLSSGGFSHLLVAEGGGGGGASLSPSALTAVQTFVRSGGIYVGERGEGLAVAQAAGVTGTQARPAPPGLVVAGALLGLSQDTADPLAWGQPASAYAFNAGDPILVPGPAARVAARYPDTPEGPFVSGYTEGTDALRGVPAVLDEPLGSGRTVLFSFDPAFRAYTPGTERLLANALLYPPSAGAARRRSPTSATAPLTRWRSGRVVSRAVKLPATGARPTVVRVADGDGPALTDAVRASGLPPGWRMTRAASGVSLTVPNTGEAADPERRLWLGRLLARLSRERVRPTLVVL
jgi:hypothetical protein